MVGRRNGWLTVARFSYSSLGTSNRCRQLQCDLCWVLSIPHFYVVGLFLLGRCFGWCCIFLKTAQVCLICLFTCVRTLHAFNFKVCSAMMAALFGLLFFHCPAEFVQATYLHMFVITFDCLLPLLVYANVLFMIPFAALPCVAQPMMFSQFAMPSLLCYLILRLCSDLNLVMFCCLASIWVAAYP